MITDRVYVALRSAGAQLLRARLRDRACTVRSVSAGSGVPREHITRWLVGRSPPSVERFAVLMAAAGIERRELERVASLQHGWLDLE